MVKFLNHLLQLQTIYHVFVSSILTVNPTTGSDVCKFQSDYQPSQAMTVLRELLGQFMCVSE